MHQKECAALPKQPTPRKGTETDIIDAFGLLNRNNPHPARGRKRVIHSPFSSFFIETTHTPQGDGNISFSPWISIRSASKQPTPRKGTETSASRPGSPSGLPRNNPHPARGRKPSRIYPTILLATWKQPTPRKGTETFRRSCSACPRRGRNNPHPARGRKRLIYYTIAAIISKQPTPRKGTETLPLL